MFNKYLKSITTTLQLITSCLCILMTFACGNNDNTPNKNNDAIIIDIDMNDTSDLPGCGDGQIQEGELCDGNCPTSCDDNDPCTEDTLIGSAQMCDARCEHKDICIKAVCGNDILEPGERCDGNCPTACDDGDACTKDVLLGSADQCDAFCIQRPQTQCLDDDGCCPKGCSAAFDNDCQQDASKPGFGCMYSHECETIDPNNTTYCIATSFNEPDGLCTQGCQTNNDCPQNMVCLGRACRPACPADRVCEREGFTCSTWDGTSYCRHNPLSFTRGRVGAACESAQDCVGLLPVHDWRVNIGYCLDLPGGYCTFLRCRNNNDCGAGNICEPNTQVCYKGCQSDSNCQRDDYTCRDIGFSKICAPKSLGRFGQACQEDDDCFSGDCKTEARSGWPGGYCSSKDCQTNGCFDDAFCHPSGECRYACQLDQECRQGYQCTKDALSDQKTCQPFKTGGATIGGACKSDMDCGQDPSTTCLQLEDRGYPLGYCTIRNCTDQACPSGSHCAIADKQLSEAKTCMKSCDVDAQCRPGYVCVDRDFDQKKECRPIASGPRPIGASCVDRSQCQGGFQGFCLRTFDHLEGYCTSGPCYTDNNCPSNAHCIIPPNQQTGTCLQRCTGQSDCRQAHLCQDLLRDNRKVCYPHGKGTTPIGGACQSASDCDAGEQSYCLGSDEGTWTDGYCTKTCRPGQCGAGGVCLTRQGETFGACYSTCRNTVDCRVGYHCRTFPNSTVRACFPDAF